MKRRFLAAALAALSIVILGTYLAYTQYLVQRIQQENAIHGKVHAIVQKALLTMDAQMTDSLGNVIATSEGVAETAILDLQQQLLQELDVPIIIFDGSGQPTVARNLPFEYDLTDPVSSRRVHEYAARLKSQRPENVVTATVFGEHNEIIFGDPPSLQWLRYIPYLQVGAGVLLILVAFFIMRADMRAHREQLWSAMARELAHQMGTPLSSLAGWVEVLQLNADQREGMPETPRIGELMESDVQRLERVSRRFELIGKPPALQPVALEHVVRELTAYFTPRLPHLGKGVKLRARVESQLPQVEANQVLLVWALENIVKNAIDALAGRGGRISILALTGESAALNSKERGSVHIVIADTGPGIAVAVKERIFDPGVSTKTAGWGVGLSLSRRIVEELHHGRITVENRPRGGAVFDVMLPATRT